MKVCILGANGNSGRRIVAQAIAAGHSVTAVVRKPFATTLFPEARTVQVDYSQRGELIEAMHGHDVVLNAAGHVTNPTQFVALVADVVAAAEEALGRGGRFWMFAGAALLDVPGTGRMTISLPGVPDVYAPHVENFRTVKQSSLAWSVLCPGPLIESPDNKPHSALIVSCDHWPVPPPSYARFLPPIVTSLAFKKIIDRMTVYYDDVAKVILDNLGSDLIGKRVGIALPGGMRLSKPDAR
jgi:uncharacterized protein